MIKLSVAIITLNEEHNIERCINSIKEIADEIIVIDSFSTDRTEEICLSHDVKFIQQQFLGHIEQKNFAIKSTSHEYILSLDADEALDTELIQKIKEIKTNFSYDAYYFSRLTIYIDKPIFHCGWYPDKKLRLFKKNMASWGGTNPHDILQLKEGGTSHHIRGNILHYSYDSISDHVRQTNKFTTIAAKAAYKEGKRSNVFHIFTRPVLKFLRDYFLMRGFLDGRYGFIICYINSMYALLKYSKLKDIQDGRPID